MMPTDVKLNAEGHTGWQPIDTAPKQGQCLDILMDNGRAQLSVRWGTAEDAEYGDMVSGWVDDTTGKFVCGEDETPTRWRHSALTNSKPTPAVGDDGLIEQRAEALLDALTKMGGVATATIIRADGIPQPFAWDRLGATGIIATALAAAHSQHEADVARIGELTDIADEFDCWVKAALDCKDWHWDGDQREAAEFARSRFAAALAGVKP